MLTGYDVVLTATPGNTGTANQTIDRVYTGFLQLTKTSTIINGTGVGNGPAQAGDDDPVPGADIEYTITYRNISLTGGDATNGNLTARNIRIVEDGDDGTNTWGATTDYVGTPAPTDSIGGITAVVYDPADLRYTDTIYPTSGGGGLAPQTQGTFVFRRKIKGLAPQVP